MADRIIGTAVKGIASGIGLVSEGIHHHKERKAAKARSAEAQGEEGSSHNRDSEHDTHHTPLQEGDEEHWDLDDAQHELINTKSNASDASHDSMSKRDQINPTKVTDAFIRRHPAPGDMLTPIATEPRPVESNSHEQISAKLPLPVVLPQRRPKERARGFIRAYAPDLAIKGIDQETFLDFIETFNQASLASPWLDAINLAGLAATPLAPGISQAVQLAIMISVHIAKDVQSRKRQNTFLDRINDEFFRPRGLYCLVMTWKPESPTLMLEVDISSSIADRMSTPDGLGAKTKRAMKTSSREGKIEFTECATLVYPKLDDLVASTGAEAETKKEKMKHYKGFADRYFDQRAQAKHAGRNPDDALAKLSGPKPEFHSRYADPNHPASSGNLWSLLSGGHFNPPSRRQMFATQWNRGLGQSRMDMFNQRQPMMNQYYGRDPYSMQWYNQQYPAQQAGMMPQSGNLPSNRMGMGGMNTQMGGYGSPAGLDYLTTAIFGKTIGSPGQSPIMRLIGQNVLYLIIVNMPTEEELAAARHLSAEENADANSNTGQDQQ